MSANFENQPNRTDRLNVRSVIDEAISQSIKPQDNDPYIKSFATATADLLLNSELGMLMTFALDMRDVDKTTPSTLFNILRCAVQKQLIRMDPVGYPLDGYLNSEKYHQAVRTILEDPITSDELLLDLSWRRIQTNIGERYKSHKIIMACLEDRLGSYPRFLDIGCSEMQGPKQLYYSHLVPFTPVEFATAEDHANITPKLSLVNNILDSHKGIPGPVVGIDPNRPDTANMDWIIACSFKPGELARNERTTAFNSLRHLDSKQLHGYWQRFNEASMEAFLEADFQSSGDFTQFEVITFTTMLNQLHEQDVVSSQELARKFLTPSGVIIYQDRVMPDPLNSSRLKFLESYNDYNYRTLIEFADDPTHTLHDVLQWETGRCMTLRPGPKLAELLSGQLG